jgi:hypothetical protein
MKDAALMRVVDGTRGLSHDVGGAARRQRLA